MLANITCTVSWGTLRSVRASFTQVEIHRYPCVVCMRITAGMSMLVYVRYKHAHTLKASGCSPILEKMLG